MTKAYKFQFSTSKSKDYEALYPRAVYKGWRSPWCRWISLIWTEQIFTSKAVCCRTLYCAKGNYEFGISRVIKSLEPYQKKLGTDTWYYAKRCFLSLIENMSKHMIMMRDAVIQECIQFLEHCESKCTAIDTHDLQNIQLCWWNLFLS